MWLMSRLGRFWQQYPEIELQLQHSFRAARVEEFRAGQVDLAIRWGVGPWPGLDSVRIFWADLQPVCSPALAAGDPPLRALEDLRHHVLLHEVGYDGWDRWLTAAGLADLEPRNRVVIDDMGVMLRAAVEGRGIALFPQKLVEEPIRDGRLVAPFGLGAGPRAGYHLVYLPGARERPAIEAFCAFVLTEAEGEDTAR